MRLIDADKLLQKLEKVYDTINLRLIGGKSIRALILNIKKYCKYEQFQIDPESLRKYGKWEECATYKGKKYYRCSVCGYSYPIYENTRYCQHCGAKMDLGEGEA